MTTTARARTAADLLVLLPYQLGYHPTRSVVVTLMHGRRLGMIQRLDHAPPEDAEAVAVMAMDVAERQGPDAVVIAGFEDIPEQSLPLRLALIEAARQRGLPVAEHLVARDGRWYAPDCDQPCCPDAGLRLPQPADVPAVAEFVSRGVSPLPSRDHLVGELLGPPEPLLAEAVAEHVARRGGTGWPSRTVRTRVWRTLLEKSGQPVDALPDAAVAAALASLLDVGWRDALLAVTCPGVVPTSSLAPRDRDDALAAAAGCAWLGEDPAGGLDEADAVRHRLADLLVRTPEQLAAPLLTVIAHLAWFSGDGTVAGACLERALDLEPGYRLAELMLRLLQHGVRPDAWAARAERDGSGDGPLSS